MLYVNRSKISVSVCLWSVLFVIGFTGAFIFIGTLCEEGPFDNPVPTILFFLLCAAGCIFLVIKYLLRLSIFSFVYKLDRLFEADADGYVPLEELARESGYDVEKTLNKLRFVIRKGWLINLNYNETDRVVLLSDKAGSPLLGGKPEDKPFIGVHCQSCGASLKVRTNTEATCPFCGRRINAS